VSVHDDDDLIRAIDRGHVSCLVLLDLSSGFGTVDHSLLTHNFAVTDTSLSRYVSSSAAILKVYPFVWTPLSHWQLQ